VSAYNWIDFESRCPVCRAAGRIEAQTHVAASYDGDDTGRFHDRHYALGEPMAWFPAADPRYPQWRMAGEPSGSDGTVEACYASCAASHHRLCAVVEFVSLVALRVVDVTPESAWPQGFAR